MPLGYELSVAHGDTAQLLHGDVPIMEATPWAPDAVTTDPVSIEDAAEARSKFVPFLDDNISMTCFSCGIHPTSMQVHGAHLGDGRYATDWTVPDWATSSLTASAALWAALDCTAAFYVWVVTVNAWRLPSSTPSTSGGRSLPESESPLSDGTAITSRYGMGAARRHQQHSMKMAKSLRSQGHLGFGP